MRRVLYVIHFPFFGGPQNQALRLAGPLSARGWETEVVFPDEPGNAPDRLAAAGIPLRRIRLNRLRAVPDPGTQASFALGFAGDIRRLRETIRAVRPDVVLLTGIVNTPGAFAARLEGVPLVWQVLDTRTPGPLRLALGPLASRMSDSIMTTGHAIATSHHLGPRGMAKVVEFYPPVDTRVFRPDPEARRDSRERLGLRDSDILVGALANLTPQKGLEHFVEMARRLRSSGTEARFVIVGSPMETHAAYEMTLREAAAGYRAAFGEPLQIVDPLTRPERWLNAFDIFVLSSVPRSEGVPTTVLEAMATAVPVVATDVGATSEVVSNGRTGYVVRPEDPGALAEMVGPLVGDEARRRAFGEAARRIAVAEYDVERCADTHVRAFEGAIRNEARRRRPTARGQRS